MVRITDKTRLPVNVNEFSPKILGINAKLAVAVVMTVSFSAIVSRFSIELSFITLIACFTTLLPVKNGKTTASLIFGVLNWKLSSIDIGHGAGIRIDEIRGRVVIRDSKRIGVCCAVETEGYSAWSDHDRKMFHQAFSRALTRIQCSCTFISVPTEIRNEDYYSTSAHERGRDYNLLVDYMFSGQFYYENLLILWKRTERDDRATLDYLLDSFRTVQQSVSGMTEEFYIIGEKSYLEHFLAGMS